MQHTACSSVSGRKGVPLDVWGAADAKSLVHGDEFKSPWQTHRAGISQASSSWSSAQGQCHLDPRARHSHNHNTAASSRTRAAAVSDREFPSLSSSNLADAPAAVAKHDCRGGSVGYASCVARRSDVPPAGASSILLRECVKELRRLFPKTDRDILEDVTAGVAASFQADGSIGDLLEQAVSWLLDVFSDDPGVHCAFPKFQVSQTATAAEPSTWKDKVGHRAAAKQKKTAASAVASHSSDMDFYRAAIDSLTDKSSRQEPVLQEHAETNSLFAVQIEGISGAALRKQSHQIAESRAQLFAEAARAFISGDTKLAKELSVRGHELSSEFRDLSAAAAGNIFLSKNRSLDEGVLDLHGLHRDEAFDAVTLFVEHLRLNPPISSLGSPLVICGKGIHSKGAPVLQATAKEALLATGCSFHVLPGGTGTLVLTNW
jgi:hypothetical protein